MTSRSDTCEARIAKHAEGRLDDFRTLAALSQLYDGAGLDELHEQRSELIAKGEDLGVDWPESPEGGYSDADADDVRESALERIYEYPLGVGVRTVFRVELSTGGPADWLEVVCASERNDDSQYGPVYEIERIVYHFADWFDHAERDLNGDDFANAEAFVRQVVGELA